jgi:Ca2+-binding RTX toxin-like protein
VPLYHGSAVDTSVAGVAGFGQATRGVTADLDTVNGWESALLGAAPQSVARLNGSAYNDALTGDARANTLDGGAGADTLTGGGGNDTYIVDNVGDVVVEAANDGVDTVQASVSATLATNVENLTLTGGNAINGTGNALANLINGNSANNTLTGGGGNDIVDGGAGTDTLVLSGARSNYTVTQYNGSATEFQVTDRVANRDGQDIFRNIEFVRFSDGTFAVASLLTNNQTLTGTAGNDTLTGGSGNDILIGGAGADVLNGGAGTDTASYSTASVGVYVHMLDRAQNTGDANGDSYNSIENLMGSNFADTLIADDSANTINGGNGNDVLLGLIGNDTLYGDAGSDGLYGGDGRDALYGGASDDSLFGDAGNDRLDGGAGNDWLVGGTGDDTFVFGPGGGIDTIHDFVAGTANTTEVIDLRGFGITSIGALRPLMTEAGGTTTINFADGSRLTLDGVTRIQLVSNDFIWG